MRLLYIHLLLISLSISLINSYSIGKKDKQRIHVKSSRRLEELSIGINTVLSSSNDTVAIQPLCIACTAGVSAASLIIKFDQSEPAVLLFATTICKLFVKESWAICDGISTEFREEFFYVFRRMSGSPAQICGLLMPDCADPFDPMESGWTVQIPDKEKEEGAKSLERVRQVLLNTNSLQTNSIVTKPENILKDSNEDVSPPLPLRVLHLSDIHIDPEYETGSEGLCDEPVCCRERIANAKQPAGYWGTVGRCDIPLRLFENMLQHINKTHFIDYIVMSGDIVNHADWKYTINGTLDVMKELNGLFEEYFPRTPVYWALGNHEGVPVNSFAPHTVDEYFWPKWLYDQMWNVSKKWLKNETEAQGTIAYRGSYTVSIRDKLRLISINTGFCETTNFFLYLNQSDPDGTMSWFVQQLYQAELRGEKVQILGHIPPGDGECLEGWARNYYTVIQRFHKIIVGQFFGHVHWDYFTVFFEDMHNITSTPVGVLYAAPSVTTYEMMNPAYRIYAINTTEDSFIIEDHENYHADMSKMEWNSTAPPQWKLLYSAKTNYSLHDLSAQSWNDLIEKIEENEEGEKHRDNFFQFSTRRLSDDSDTPGCDTVCQHTLLCGLRSGHHNDTLYCNNNALYKRAQQTEMKELRRRMTKHLGNFGKKS